MGLHKMTTQNLTLFKGLSAKMSYLHQRQGLIAQNIANADTPGYVPRDVSDVDFGAVVDSVQRSVDAKSTANVRMAKTEGASMRGSNGIDLESKVQRQTYEVAPAGNAVIMEEQLIKSQETQMDFNMMTNLYQKNMSMIKQSLGRQ